MKLKNVKIGNKVIWEALQRTDNMGKGLEGFITKR
jgi:hypothetical protein